VAYFQKVYGTDTNPNAIIGLKEFMGDTKLSRKIEPEYGNLFGKWDKPTELIVFNPPWLPATHDLDQLDRAIYYEENLFPEFFAAAHKHLLPDGKLVLIFSNLGLVTGLIQKHPIVEELETGQRFRLEQCIKKAVKPASDKTKRNAYWRSQEEVELWVLNLL
jgi:methylase of polypeptide subunit release factors